MPEEFGMVKVGNSEWGFLKFTPASRNAAIAGAVSGVTFSARRPSGTNRIKLWGVALAAWLADEKADSCRPAMARLSGSETRARMACSLGMIQARAVLFLAMTVLL